MRKQKLRDHATRLRRLCRETGDICAVFLSTDHIHLALSRSNAFEDYQAEYLLVGFYDERIRTPMLAEDIAEFGVQVE